MSVTSALSGLGASLLGNPKKALLIISHAENGGGMDEEKLAAKTQLALESASALGHEAEQQAMDALAATGYHILQVQYNPNSIRFSANAVPTPVKYLEQNLDNGTVNQNQRPPSIVMSVDLVFDAVNNKDAFMFEKLRISAGDMVSNAAAMANKWNKKIYTVQPQTNGLLAVLMRKSTRNVIFKWADVTFSGEVTEVSARYTMFSVSGNPIRSIVQLNMMQEVAGKSSTTYWNNRFDKCFGDEYTAKDSGGKDPSQLMGNLLNIGF